MSGSGRRTEDGASQKSSQFVSATGPARNNLCAFIIQGDSAAEKRAIVAAVAVAVAGQELGLGLGQTVDRQATTQHKLNWPKSFN